MRNNQKMNETDKLLAEIKANIRAEQKAIDDYNRLISHLRSAGLQDYARVVENKIRDDEREHKQILTSIAKDLIKNY